MNRTEWLQETRKMRFEEAYQGWQSGRLRQEEAARLLWVYAIERLGGISTGTRKTVWTD